MIEHIIICSYWGAHSVTSVKKHCFLCNASLALAADNEQAVKKMNMFCVCTACANKEMDRRKEKVIVGGGLVGGELIGDLDEAMQIAKNQIQKEGKDFSKKDNDGYSF